MKRCTFLALMALTLALVAAPAWAWKVGSVIISGDTDVHVGKGSPTSASYTVEVKDDGNVIQPSPTLTWITDPAPLPSGITFDTGTKTLTVADSASAGTETITITVGATGGDDTMSDDITVTVTVMDLTGLSPADESVEVGKTVTLTATTVPTGLAVNWETSSSDIATVANGVVTGKASGDVTITAKLASADTISKTATIHVTPVVPKVTLDKTTETVKIGETKTLTAKTTPVSQDVEWESSDTAIATVVASGDYGVEGVVTGKASGDVTIWAKLKSDGTVSTDCTVKVVSEDVATITLLSEDVKILKGSTGTIGYTVSPDMTVTWSTDSTDIAVFGGPAVLLGVELGTTTFRATAGTASADSTVKVVDTLLSVSPTTASLALGGTATATLIALVQPAERTVTWTTSDPTVVTVSPDTGGVVTITAVKVGTATITATAGTATATCAVTVTGSAPTDSGIGSVGIPTVDADGDVSLLITSSDGTPARDADVDFWLELVSLTTSGVRASAVGEVYGRFVARTSSDGYLKIDPDALRRADGEKGSIPAGRYDVYVAKRGAVSSYADAKKAPVSVPLDATTPTGHSSGGCSAGFGALALIAAAAAATRRKR